MRIAIRGIGPVGGFGTGLVQFRSALTQGGQPPSMLPVKTENGVFDLPVFIPDFAPLEDFFPKKSLRRIDRYAKLALLGACLALKDADLLEQPKDRLGVIVASGYGATGTTFSFLDSVINDGDPLASPTHFSNSVHNAAAAHLSILLNATGPSLTVSQFELSLASALFTARQWLVEGRVDTVLLGGVDQYCEVLGYCWWRYFGTWPPALTPLNFERQTAVPGEGAAFFVLTPETATEQKSYATIEDVCLGRLDAGLSLPQGALVLGADGHVSSGRRYQALLSESHSAIARADLWGSLPVGQGFDLAFAALGLSDNRPTSAFSSSQAAQCLKCTPAGEFGLISLSQTHGVPS